MARSNAERCADNSDKRLFASSAASWARASEAADSCNKIAASERRSESCVSNVSRPAASSCNFTITPSVSCTSSSSRRRSFAAWLRRCFSSDIRLSTRFSSSSKAARSSVMRCKTAARMVSCSRKFGKVSPSSSRPRKACDAPTVCSPKMRVASFSAAVSAFIASAASRQATNRPAASSLRISLETCLYFTAWRAWRFRLESWLSNCAITSSRRERLASAAFNFNSASWRRVCRPVIPAASSNIKRRA